MHYKVWNTNLRKETDERVAKAAKNMSIAKKDKPSNALGKRWKVKDTSNMKGNRNAKGQKMSKEGRIKWLRKMKGRSTQRKGVSQIEEYGEKKAREMQYKNRQAALKRLSTGQGKYRNTSIEMSINKELQRRGYIEKKDYFRNKPLLNMFNVDFYFPTRKIVIECDGDYWHNLPGAQERDKLKDKKLKENGFQIYRFWEHEINKSSMNCINKIF